MNDDILKHILVKILTARKNYKVVDGEMGKANWTMSSWHWEEKEGCGPRGGMPFLKG